MIWYWLALLGATLVTGGGIYLAYRLRKDKLDDFWIGLKGKVETPVVNLGGCSGAGNAGPYQTVVEHHDLSVRRYGLQGKHVLLLV